MREIKFRAWDKERKYMWPRVEQAYDTLYEDHNIKTEKGHDCLMNCSFGDILSDKSLIVMQYTGLKDKNGKEIYEGDIIEMVNKWEVTYFCCGFVLMRTYFGEHIKLRLEEQPIWSKAEIIGNIYENPELVNADTV